MPGALLLAPVVAVMAAAAGGLAQIGPCPSSDPGLGYMAIGVSVDATAGVSAVWTKYVLRVFGLLFPLCAPVPRVLLPQR